MYCLKVHDFLGASDTDAILFAEDGKASKQLSLSWNSLLFPIFSSSEGFWLVEHTVTRKQRICLFQVN